jgi:uncharacterized membrane protein
MTTTTIRTALLMTSTIAMGLITGVFALYAHTIMPGLRRTDDRTFVGSFQAIDRAIINPWFIVGTFLAALVLTLGAAISSRGQRAFPWLAAALVAYLVAVAITAGVHVPLNDAIKAAGVPDRIDDLARVRARFDEARWAGWNIVRVVASATAFASLTWALFLHGRSLA